MPEPLTESDKTKANEHLRQARRFIKTLEDAGAKVPPRLTKSLTALQIALDTGADLGDAFEEASSALGILERDMMRACHRIDSEMDLACAAGVARQWQWRNVLFVLDFKNPQSMSAVFIRNTVRRYTPTKICDHWKYCSKRAIKEPPAPRSGRLP